MHVLAGLSPTLGQFLKNMVPESLWGGMLCPSEKCSLLGFHCNLRFDRTQRYIKVSQPSVKKVSLLKAQFCWFAAHLARTQRPFRGHISNVCWSQVPFERYF